MEPENNKVIKSFGECFKNIKRVHVLMDVKSLGDIAVFLTSSLLLSHGIRRDVVSVIKLKNSWLCVPGFRVRHLRPDFDSALGWVRAVLKRSQNEVLGSIKLSKLYFSHNEFKVVKVLCNLNSSFQRIKQMMLTSFYDKVIFEYYSDVININDNEEALDLFGVECKYAPILMNISLDRIDENKKPLLFK